jgi:predicted glycoside hydrolase/deacetylase ChbG (UPF0249 family)
MNSSRKKLIVNADDFGQSKGINKGIIEAHEKGIVTSASLMIRYPSAVEAVEYGKSNPSLGVGLHLDFGEWIFKDGEWKALYEVVALDNKEEVNREINNQIEAFFKIMGRKPSHMDSHQHVHLKENVQTLLAGIAQELNIIVRRCNDKVNYCGNFYGQCHDGSPYHQAISVAGLKQTLINLPDGITELACHPGLGEDVETMYRKEREIEVRTLSNKFIKETIAKENIELCTFQQVSSIN